MDLAEDLNLCPRPSAAEVVAHSPTPSIVMIRTVGMATDRKRSPRDSDGARRTATGRTGQPSRTA